MFKERAYRCLVFDPTDRQCCDRPIHAFSDTVAIERADLFLRHFQCGAGVRMELWRGSQVLRRQEMPRPSEASAT